MAGTMTMRETPDVETSSAGYAARFQGEVGRYLLGVQERGVLELMLGEGLPTTGRSVLDVGGGHAQLAPPLAREGFDVTVLGSDDRCAARLPAGGAVRFASGDLLDQPFGDGSFDAVVSVRLISHMTDWEGLVAELCRVARRTVVIDYPTLASLNALSALAFPLKRAIERNTRTYRSFSPGELHAAFAQHGFRPVRAIRQFVVPMGLHRLLGGSGLARGVEEGLRRAGVTRLLGNPVLLRLDREVA